MADREAREFVKRLTRGAADGRARPPEDEPAEGQVAAEAAQDKDAPVAVPVAAVAPPGDLYTFAGFLGDQLSQPGLADKRWQVLYLDLALKSWLLVEDGGIVTTEQVVEDKAPDQMLDVLWVTGDAAVGMVSGSQSLEAQFLTGEFTRAADFQSSPSGGTLAAATGVFCDAQSIGCCRPTRRT
jgi:hypothetical protein